MSSKTFNNTKINVEFDEDYQSRININSGENISSLFAKIRRFILDLKPVALTGDYNDLTNIPDSTTVLNTANGNPITLTDGTDAQLVALHLYGNSVQDGTPTPDAPVDIVSVGDNGSVIITVDNNIDVTLSAEITSGLPLCSVNGVRDELIYNADGTGKIVNYTVKKRVTADNSLHHNWQAGAWGIEDFFVGGIEVPDFVSVANCYCNYAPFDRGADSLVSTAGAIGVAQGGGKKLYFRFSSEHTTHDAVTNYLNNNEIYIVYQLATPKEIELSAAEMTALMELQTFDGITNIYNYDGAEMKVKYWCDNSINALINNKVSQSQLSNHIDNETNPHNVTKEQIGINSLTTTLTAANWIDNAQTVSVSSVTSTNTVIVSPTPDNQDNYISAGIKCTAQSDGALTFICNTAPTNDINVNIVTL